MSVSASALAELHRIHKQLSDLRERKDRGPRQIKAREINLIKQNEELTRLQGEQKAARVRSDQKNLLLRSGEQKVEDLKVKLNQSSSNREYQALKDQIAADQMAGSVLADEILEAMEKVDELAAHIAEQQKNVDAAKAEVTRATNAVRDQAGMLDSEIARLEGELAVAEKELPGEFLDTYKRLVKGKGEDAMAEVQGEFCGGCYQQLTPNNMSELQMWRSIVCRNCGRLVYKAEERSATS